MAKLCTENIKDVLKRPNFGWHFLTYGLTASHHEKLLNQFLNVSDSEVKGYANDLLSSGLRNHIKEKELEFYQVCEQTIHDGRPAMLGGISAEECSRLYRVMRHFKPSTIVETGVSSGTSSSYLLQALTHNDTGKLYSIDKPNVRGAMHPLEKQEEWQKTMRVTLPEGYSTGWIIPADLRTNWQVRLGASEDLLKPLLDELGSIDVFLHDSLHSYENMAFEFDTAYQHLRPGGLLLSDDIHANTAFNEFCKKHQLKPLYLGWKLGLVQKPY